MQRGQHEVAGLRGGERGADGLGVAHLADEDDVGVLAQDVLERARKAARVGADLALVDGREDAPVRVLNRILDGDAPARSHVVDAVDDARQRRGLARASRPDHQQQALRAISEVHDHIGQTQLFGVRNMRGDRPKRSRHPALLEIRVDPEPASVVNRERKIHLALQLVQRPLPRGHHRIQQHPHIAFGQDLLRQGPQRAGHPDQRRAPAGQVQIAGATLIGLAKHRAEIEP